MLDLTAEYIMADALGEFLRRPETKRILGIAHPTVAEAVQRNKLLLLLRRAEDWADALHDEADSG